MTWKETIPGAVIVSGSIMLYSMNLQGISMLPVAAFMGMLVVLAGALVRVHNHFMEPAIAPLNIPVTADTFDVVGQHVACAAKGVVTALNNALAWDKPVKSASVLAHLWLVYRFSGILSSPTFWLAGERSWVVCPVALGCYAPAAPGPAACACRLTPVPAVPCPQLCWQCSWPRSRSRCCARSSPACTPAR